MNLVLSAPTFDQEEIDLAIGVLKSGRLTMGSHCLQFEKAFSDHLDVPHSVFVNSGSSANLLAFFVLANPLLPLLPGKKKPERGMEVLVPAVTWSTTVWPVVQAGFKPVLVDSDPKTLQMDMDSLKRSINQNTIAICPVHVLGNSVDLKAVLQIAEQEKLWVIEDTCEALGTRYSGRSVGTFGDFGTYSFYFSHHITTIEGGMVVTPHAPIADLLRSMRAHGWTRGLEQGKVFEAAHPEIDPRFLFITTGFNLRPTEINAVFGLSQLKKLEGFNQRRVEIAKSWSESFKKLSDEGILVPMQVTAQADCTWFGFPVLCKDQKTRDGLKAHLEKRGVETRPIICGNLAKQPAMKQIPHECYVSLDGADQIMERGLFWGSHPIMSEEEVNYLIQTVMEYFK